MKYFDLLDERTIENLSKVEYISYERKLEIIDNLNTKIDDRFSDFKHIIIPTPRRLTDHEPLEKELYIDPFRIDQSKIMGSKALRRLGDKAQVLPNAKEVNSHMRNRLTHSLEVADLSEMFCDMMNHYFAMNKSPIRLNKELCKAIALSHDIGHTPLGHIGEDCLTERTGKEFKHNEFSTIVAENLERKGNGLNLTNETLIGILNHTTNGGALDLRGLPQEYAVVRIMDKVAYVLSDFNDGLRQGYIDKNIAPLFNKLGQDQRERTVNILNCLVEESYKNGYITFGNSEIGKIFNNVKGILFDEYYKKVDQERREPGYEKLNIIYDFFKRERPDIDPAIAVALLTDNEAMEMANILKKEPNISYQELLTKQHIGVEEILPYIDGRDIDYASPAIEGMRKQIDKHIPLEIEKKFLVQSLPENLESYKYADITQGYLAMNASNEVRIRKLQKSDGTVIYTRTIKDEQCAGINKEKESEISQEKFDYLFQFTSNQTVCKRRYYIPLENNLTIELDIFPNEEPIAEVEFPNTESSHNFKAPIRFGKEVTSEKQYKNVQRAMRNSKE